MQSTKEAGLKPVRLNFLLRDANQALIGGRERTERNVEKAELAQEAGFDGIEVWGGTQLEIPARFKGEDPFDENLYPIAKVSSEVDRIMLLRSQSGNGRRIFSDRAIELEMDVVTTDDHITTIRAFDATNNMFNMQTIFDERKKLQEQGRVARLQAAMSYALSEPMEGDPEGWVYRDRQFYIALADQYVAAGADELCIKDMAGTMLPEDATFIISKIKENHPDIPLTLHMHASGGQALATLLAAIKAGVDTVDVGCEGMADWVGHVSVQDLIYAMENSEDDALLARMPQMNMKALDKLTKHNLESRMLYREFELAYDPDIQKKIKEVGLPGGMATTFVDAIKKLFEQEDAAKRQKLTQKNELPGKPLVLTGQEIKEAVLSALDAVPKVIQDLGHLERVTPTSDIVGKQAAYNWFYQEKGADPYTVFGPGFAEYVLGKQGYSQNKPREEIIKMVEDRTRQERYESRPADLIEEDEILVTTTKLEEVGIEPTKESILIALMSGDDGAGIGFLRSRKERDPSLMKSREKPPEPHPYFNCRVSPAGYLGAFEESKLIGLIAESLIQSAQKLQMIADGASFADMPEKLKKKYINDLCASIEKRVKAIPDRLEEVGFNKLQILTRIFDAANVANTLVDYLRDRAETLGVRKEFIPVISEKPSYRPAALFNDNQIVVSQEKLVAAAG